MPLDAFFLSATLAFIWLFYILGLCIYRVWFSPVAHIPGPLLAKLTYWYEFYYDVCLTGSYVWKIRDLHNQYGPIIRINPEEVHIIDATFYDEVYIGASTTKKRDKWPWMYSSFGINSSTFATSSHDLHKSRRAALNPFFSKQKVRLLQSRILNISSRFMKRVEEYRDNGEIMPIGLGWTAVTSDVAGSYAYGAQEYNRVDQVDFSPDLHVAGEAVAKSSSFIKQFPLVQKLMNSLPDAWVIKAAPDFGTIINFQRSMQRRTAAIRASYVSPDYKSPTETTIFHEILNSPLLSEEEKAHTRLWQEGQIVLLAGTVTTAISLSYLTFYMLSQPDHFRRLRDEIKSVMPDKETLPELKTLEQLPYFTACLNEILRMSNGLSTRLQRIDPENPIIYTDRTAEPVTPTGDKSEKGGQKTWIIPPNNPVSMTMMLMHLDPEYFPQPHEFNPHRWLDQTSDGKYVLHTRNNKFFAPFSRGTRACLGINLAWAELYIFPTLLFRRYGSDQVRLDDDDGIMELYETTYEQDIEVIGDGITPIVREGRRGVRVKVKPAAVA